MRTPALAFALLLPALAAHADPAADFERLMAALPGLDFGGDPNKQSERIRTMVAGLTGQWIRYQQVQHHLEEDYLFPETEHLAELCKLPLMQITPAGEFGFDVTRRSKTLSVTYSMQWVGGSTFVSTTKGNELLEFLFGKDYLKAGHPDVQLWLYSDPWLGLFDVTQVSADLLLLQYQRDASDLLIRCPERPPTP